MKLRKINLSRLRVVPILLGLVYPLLSCGHSPGKFAAKLVASESEVETGKSVRVSVELQNPPEGLRYVWRAGPGQCSPQEGSESTTYFAPSSLSEEPVEVIVAVDIFQGAGSPLMLQIPIIVKKGATQSPGKDERAADSATPVRPPSSNARQPVMPITPVTEENQPVIHIRQVPPSKVGGPNEMFDIAGDVSGVDPRKFHIVLYSYSNQWWIQPYDYDWTTRINSDGTWSNSVHGGTRYAALLVSDSFKDLEPTTYSLPRISSDVVALTIVPGKRE